MLTHCCNNNYHCMLQLLYIMLLSVSENGLFKLAEGSTLGYWLDNTKTLEHYNLKSGDMLHYKSKIRMLRVKTLDDSMRTLLVDESQTVTEVIKAVCAKIGIYNIIPTCSATCYCTCML